MNSIPHLNDLLSSHNCVISINIEMQDFKYNLSLTMSSSSDPETAAVPIKFHDVSALHLKGFGGGLTQFMDLSVTRIDDGLDRIRYELRDVEEEKISFYFLSFSTTVQKV